MPGTDTFVTMSRGGTVDLAAIFYHRRVRIVREHPPRASNESWYQYVRAEPSFPFNWHNHREHELTLVRRGRGRRFVGDSVEAYGPGDLVLVGADLPHTWQSDDLPAGPHEAVCIQLCSDFLGPQLIRRPEFAAIGRVLDDAAQGLAFPDQVARTVTDLTADLGALPPDVRTITLLLVLVALARAHDDGRTRRLATAAFDPVLRADQRDRLERVCRMVAEHYPEPLTLGAAAREAGMAPAAFSRLFSRGIGRSFTEHVTDIRLDAARQRLRHTDAPITTIAHRCGFANLANFNRRFRAAVGATPSDYRRSTRRVGDERLDIEVPGAGGGCSAEEVAPGEMAAQLDERGGLRFALDSFDHDGDCEIGAEGQKCSAEALPVAPRPVLEHAPYCGRDLRGPVEPLLVDADDVEVLVKHRGHSIVSLLSDGGSRSSRSPDWLDTPADRASSKHPPAATSSVMDDGATATSPRSRPGQ